jgi:hypothetical protein
MTVKKQAEIAQGAKPAKSSTPDITSEGKTIKTATELLQERLKHYSELHAKVKQRNTLQAHFDTLDALNISKPIQPFEESERHGVESIKLYIGRSEEYELKNPTLLEEVRNFLKSKIQNRLAELEKEILEATI